MIKAKAIQPKAFKPEVFRQTMHAAALYVASGMVGDFEKTTRTWKTPVKFTGVVQDTPTGVIVDVTTNSKVFEYVDEGTKSHIIKPKKAGGRLFFRTKYRAKTTPNVINSHQGGSSGDTAVAKQVRHPGTKARNFTKAISKRWQPKLKERVRIALAKAARESGHGET